MSSSLVLHRPPRPLFAPQFFSHTCKCLSKWGISSKICFVCIMDLLNSDTRSTGPPRSMTAPRISGYKHFTSWMWISKQLLILAWQRQQKDLGQMMVCLKQVFTFFIMGRNILHRLQWWIIQQHCPNGLQQNFFSYLCIVQHHSSEQSN